MPNIATRFQPDISGSAVPAGYIGQELIISTNWSGTTLTANTDLQFNNVTSSTLPSGIWLCQVIAQCSGTAAGTINIEMVVFAGSTASGGTAITQATNANPPGGSGRDTAARSSLFYYNSAGLTGNVSGTGQFSLQIRSNGATNTLYAASIVGQLRAIRIA